MKVTSRTLVGPSLTISVSFFMSVTGVIPPEIITLFQNAGYHIKSRVIFMISCLVLDMQIRE